MVRLLSTRGHLCLVTGLLLCSISPSCGSDVYVASLRTAYWGLPGVGRRVTALRVVTAHQNADQTRTIWRALLQSAIRVIPKSGLAMSLQSSQIRFWKRFFQICVDVCIYVHIYKELFSKAWPHSVTNSMFEAELIAFWKRSVIDGVSLPTRRWRVSVRPCPCRCRCPGVHGCPWWPWCLETSRSHGATSS